MDKFVMGIVTIFIFVAVAIIIAYIFRNAGLMKIDPAGQNGTMVLDTPIICYRIPEKQGVKQQVHVASFTIGRDSSCDIVIRHETVSSVHARISLRVRTNWLSVLLQRPDEECMSRSYVLTNLSKTNPVVYVDPSGSHRNKAISGSFPLRKGTNCFLFGSVPVKIMSGDGKKRQSAGNSGTGQ